MSGDGSKVMTHLVVITSFGNERGWSGSVRVGQGATGPQECDGKHVIFVTVLRTR